MYIIFMYMYMYAFDVVLRILVFLWSLGAFARQVGVPNAGKTSLLVRSSVDPKYSSWKGSENVLQIRTQLEGI